MIERLDVEARSRCYSVVVGDHDVFDIELARFFKKIHSSRKIMIVSDTNVGQLWSDTISDIIKKNSGCDIYYHMIKAGEDSKCIDEWQHIITELAVAKFTRDDLIVALGGGVVGDLAGFVASTYMRGIPWIQIPTSLLAMVDSSVGGKTAVDFAHFKNIVGSFWQPLEVFANVKVLNTLPDDWLRDGLGEVLKYCLLGAGFTLDDIIRSIDSNDFLDIVKKCIKLKAYVVKNDEYDTTGVRAYLNLGHTFGHAIERTSRFKISHGIAVMLGIIAVYKFKGSSKKELEEIKSVIAKILGSEKIASLCKIISKLNVTRIVDAMALDKKLLSSEKLEIILPGSQFLLKCSKVTIPVIDVEDKFIKPALEEIMLWS